MIFNEIKCHVKSSLRLVGGDASPASPPVSARACGALGSLQIDIASPPLNQPFSPTKSACVRYCLEIDFK